MLTILVVEDEPLVRLAARTTLEAANYAVLEAENGEEGVEIFYSHLGQIDLVLLDIQMPLLNGYDALEKMRFVGQDVKVLFLTAVVMDWEEYGVDGIIQKPYSEQELLRKVREVLV